METNPFKNWWDSKDDEIRRDPIEAAQQLLVPAKSVEEVYARQGMVPPKAKVEPMVEEPKVEEPMVKAEEPKPAVTEPMDKEQPIVEVPKEPKVFDPEGSGYDMESAKSVGMEPEIDPEDNLPHYGSVIETTKEQQEQFNLPEESYMILKGKQHDTWDKAVAAEEARGFKIEKHGDRYYSVPDPDKQPKEEVLPEVQEPVMKEEKQMTDKDMKEYDRAVINETYDNLLKAEGTSGDTTGAAKTRKRGLTDEQYKRQVARLNNPNLTDEEASKAYLEELYITFNNEIEGFSKLDYDVKSDILHEAYNLGMGVKNYKNFTKAIKENNPEQIFFNLLDTANISGQTSKGIAVRRAELYNKYADAKIKTVEQLEDGTLIYSTEKGELFRYRRAKHNSSKAGKVKL